MGRPRPLPAPVTAPCQAGGGLPASLWPRCPPRPLFLFQQTHRRARSPGSARRGPPRARGAKRAPGARRAGHKMAAPHPGRAPSLPGQPRAAPTHLGGAGRSPGPLGRCRPLRPAPPRPLPPLPGPGAARSRAPCAGGRAGGSGGAASEHAPARARGRLRQLRAHAACSRGLWRSWGSCPHPAPGAQPTGSRPPNVVLAFAASPTRSPRALRRLCASSLARALRSSGAAARHRRGVQRPLERASFSEGAGSNPVLQQVPSTQRFEKERNRHFAQVVHGFHKLLFFFPSIKILKILKASVTS